MARWVSRKSSSITLKYTKLLVNTGHDSSNKIAYIFCLKVQAVKNMEYIGAIEEIAGSQFPTNGCLQHIIGWIRTDSRLIVVVKSETYPKEEVEGKFIPDIKEEIAPETA